MNKNHLYETCLIFVGIILVAIATTLFLFRDACADTAIYIDPKTGQITSESPIDDNSDAARREFQVQQEPEAQPQEVPSPVPGGGIIVENKVEPK